MPRCVRASAIRNQRSFGSKWFRVAFCLHSLSARIRAGLSKPIQAICRMVLINCARRVGFACAQGQ